MPNITLADILMQKQNPLDGGVTPVSGSHPSPVDEYARVFGYPPPADMSTEAMLRWLRSRSSIFPNAPNAQGIINPRPKIIK